MLFPPKKTIYKLIRRGFPKVLEMMRVVWVQGRVTRCVCEKVARNVAQSISCEN
jgi:hypothetical protein